MQSNSRGGMFGRSCQVDGKQILSQAECRKQFQLICRAVRQFKAIARAAEYIRRTFNEIKREFLSVIDHLETESEEKDPKERKENNERVQEELKIAYSKVSQEELEVLDNILKQVEFIQIGDRLKLLRKTLKSSMNKTYYKNNKSKIWLTI